MEQNQIQINALYKGSGKVYRFVTAIEPDDNGSMKIHWVPILPSQTGGIRFFLKESETKTLSRLQFASWAKARIRYSIPTPGSRISYCGEAAEIKKMTLNGDMAIIWIEVDKPIEIPKDSLLEMQ